MVPSKFFLKNYAPFTNCISRINSTQVVNADDIDVVMPMYNLIKCSNNYLKTSGILWQYCENEPGLNPTDDAIVAFNADNANIDSFKIKGKKKPR